MLIKLKSEWIDPRDALKYPAGTVIDIPESLKDTTDGEESNMDISYKKTDIEIMRDRGILVEAHYIKKGRKTIRGFILQNINEYNPMYAGKSLLWTSEKPADLFEEKQEAIEAWCVAESHKNKPKVEKEEETQTEKPKKRAGRPKKEN